MRAKRIHTACVTAAVLAVVGVCVAQAQDASFRTEQVTRACVSKRLTELVAQANMNVTADAALNACANGLKAEMKEKGKTECDVDDYFGWIIASENNKINGVSGQPYKPNRAFLSRCRGRAR
jgi:hypothetical protein